MKYDIGDIIQDTFNYGGDTKGDLLLVEDIDYANRVVPVRYKLLIIGTNNSVWWPIRLIDENKAYIKVA